MKNSLLIIAISLLIFGCKKDKDIITEETNTEPDLVHDIVSLDLSNAKTLMLIEETIGDDLQYILYKTTSLNSVEAVTITTDAATGTEEAGEVLNAFDVNDRYFYLSVGRFDYSHYLIDKRDGKAYHLDVTTFIYTPRLDWHINGNFSEDIFATDNSGEIYFNSQGQVIRVNVSNPNNITSEVASFDEDHVSDFAIDDAGNLVYSGEYNGVGILRAISKDKSVVKQLPGSVNRSWNYRFKGADGNLYYDYDGVSVIDFSPYGVNNYTADGTNAGCGYQLLRVKNKNASIGIGACSKVFHLDHNNGTLNLLDSWGISDDIAARANDNHYFIAYKSGSDIKLSMADPIDNVPRDLISSRYEVSGFDVTNEDDVFFAALDNQNLKTVIGKVTSSGTVTVLKEGIGSEVFFLAITNL